MQSNIGVFQGEFADNGWQRVTSLGMGRGNGQAAAALIAMLLSHLLDVFGEAQYLPGQVNNRLASRRYSR